MRTQTPAVRTLLQAARALSSDLRVHLADPFGSTPVQFGHVTVGIELNGGTTTAPPVTATFSGAQSLTLHVAARTAPAGYAVIDQGINADKVTQDGTGLPSVTTRWTHDALGQPGVRTVIEQAGINDLCAGATAATLEPAHAALVASAHAAESGCCSPP